MFALHNLCMPFYNRTLEQQRLLDALSRRTRQFIVVYGRRRAGKSTLLRRLLTGNDVYFQASQTTSAYQIERFAETLGSKFPALLGARYNDWAALLAAVNSFTRERFTLVIDELPYLVESDPELPSLLQRFVDRREEMAFDLIVCGSSQQMMRVMVISATAPLYGRANEVLKIQPLPASYLSERLPESTPSELVMEYATWGGIPRYWELRAEYDNYDDAVRQLVLQPTGVLHEEPSRLLLEEMRNTVQSSTLLALVATGVHRPSELGGRMGKPSTDLSRPLQRLIDMGYLYRELPYGTTAKQRKGSLYKVADPFLRFHYHFVYPNLSQLTPSRVDSAWERLSKNLPHFIAPQWEILCQRAIGEHPDFAGTYEYPARWWGTVSRGKHIELDLVTRAHDGTSLLVGECKWSAVTKPAKLREELIEKASQLPFYKGEPIHTILFARSFTTPDTGECWTPQNVLAAIV